jgi:hypothetical protein
VEEAATPDAPKDANVELRKQELDRISGGTTNNKQTAAQKAAEKADAYIRS